ncbi:hypothetical protein C8R46DRAFT_1349790 [Mycena filopes]|nr:hypothetical protein C8R46DRAFT_1349790 [Mycena filopes]
MPMALTFVALPGELITQIFATLIEDSGDETQEPVVLRLSSICKSIRALVVNTPTLWAYIRVRFPRDLDTAALFIAPANAQRLAVARWRRLTIQAPLWTEISTFFLKAILEIQTPHLKDVCLITRDEISCNEHAPGLLSNAADALRTLTMHGCVGCLSPFPNLTRLNIFRLLCRYEEFRDLIQNLPNLTTLILNELLDRFDPETVPEPVLVPRSTIEAVSLRFFAVGFTNAELIHSEDRPPLAFLSMPNLEYLEVSGSRTDYGELSGKSFPVLRTLCLRNMSFAASDAALYHSLTTEIIHLELDTVQGVEYLLELDEKGTLPWPRLQSLAWKDLDKEKNDGSSWLDKLSTRPRLTLKAPAAFKDDLSTIEQCHDVQLLIDESLGLIRPKDFASVDLGWPLDDEEGFSADLDEADFFEDHDDYDFEYDLEDQMEDYSEEDDYGLDDDIVGWF